MSYSSRRFWLALRLRGLSVHATAERTWNRINEHAILTRAAAVSFYAIAALVPFMALVIALCAHWLPGIERELGGEPTLDPLGPLRELMPADAASFLTRELGRLGSERPRGFVSFGLVALLWLSSSVFVEIIDAMNVISGAKETRPFWKRRLLAMVMTVSQAVILIAGVVSIVAWPQILHWLGLSQPASILATALHGITVFFTVLFSFALVLYVAPDSHRPWEWITPGSLLGTLVLMGVSLLFRIYTQNWGHYSATYGSFAGIILLMSWLWICSIVLLVSAELNQVVEDASPLLRRARPARLQAQSAAVG